MLYNLNRLYRRQQLDLLVLLRYRRRALWQFAVLFTVFLFVAWLYQSQEDDPEFFYDPDTVDAARLVRDMDPDFAFVPFDPSRPKKLVILTYQRAGSSFFGQFFNKHPGVFYVYEPLDGVYSALYGVVQAWTNPGDITMHENGKRRVVPKKELTAVTQTIDNLLSCRVGSLPAELVVHPYWYQFAEFHDSIDGYGACLNTSQISRDNCTKHVYPTCLKTFKDVTENYLNLCHDWMCGTSTLIIKDDPVVSQPKYKQCMDRVRENADHTCGDRLLQGCTSRNVRVTKTIRGSMSSMLDLLRVDSNTRIIHLIRDPRGVVKSRTSSRDPSLRSRYGRSSTLRETELYCNDVVSDVMFRRELEKSFPRHVMTVIYDDLLGQPESYAELVYRFMDVSLPEETRQWVSNHTQNKGKTVGSSFKYGFMPHEDMKSLCKQFLRVVNYRFKHWES